MSDSDPLDPKPEPNKRPYDRGGLPRSTHPRIHESYLPEFEPTDEQRITVRVMTACGMKRPEIIREIVNPHTGLPITLKTLSKHFGPELRHGKDQANAMVARSLFRKCIGDSPQAVAACIFWLRSQAGWLAPESIEISGQGPKAEGKQQLVVYVPDNGRRAANAVGIGAKDAGKDAGGGNGKAPARFVKR